MRKKVRGVGVRASPDVVDGRLWNSNRRELRSNERCEVSVRSLAFLAEHGGRAADTFELHRDVFADLERGHANVRSDRD